MVKTKKFEHYLEAASEMLIQKPLVNVIAELLQSIDTVKNQAERSIQMVVENQKKVETNSRQLKVVEQHAKQAKEAVYSVSEMTSTPLTNIKSYGDPTPMFEKAGYSTTENAEENREHHVKKPVAQYYQEPLAEVEHKEETTIPTDQEEPEVEEESVEESEPTPVSQTEGDKFTVGQKVVVIQEEEYHLCTIETILGEQVVVSDDYGTKVLVNYDDMHTLEEAGYESDDEDDENGAVGGDFIDVRKQDIEDSYEQVEMIEDTPEPSQEPVEEFQKDGTPIADLLDHLETKDSRLVKKFELCIGDEVELFSNNNGILRFAGTTHFADGNFYGIDLTDGSIGKNNGDYDGVKYFEVSKKLKGLFVRSKMIRKKIPKPVESDYIKAQREKEEKAKARELAKVQAKAKGVGGKGKSKKQKGKDMRKEESRVERMGIEVGEDVQIDMGRKGMVAYMGVIEEMHPHNLQYGIALSHGSVGNTDGSYHGIQYFDVEDRRGCFVTADKIRKRVVMTIDEKYKRRLEDILEEHDPSKLPKLKKKIRDTENIHGYYLRLCKKYGIQPQPEYRGGH